MKSWLLLLSALLFLAFYAGLRDSNDKVDSPPVYVRDCSPSLALCTLQFDAIKLLIQLQPFGLPAMEPLTLRIGADDLTEIEVIRAWFEGRDMDMGQHGLVLLTESSAPDALVFSGVIPVCSVNPQMIWQLKLLLKVGQRQQMVFFDLAGSL